MRIHDSMALLTPGDSLARKFDEGYARLMERMRRKIKKGNRRLVLYYGWPVPSACWRSR